MRTKYLQYLRPKYVLFKELNQMPSSTGKTLEVKTTQPNCRLNPLFVRIGVDVDLSRSRASFTSPLVASIL